MGGVLLTVRVVSVVPEKAAFPRREANFDLTAFSHPVLKKLIKIKTITKHTLEAQSDKTLTLGFSTLFKPNSNIFQRLVSVQLREDLAPGLRFHTLVALTPPSLIVLQHIVTVSLSYARLRWLLPYQ